MDINSVQSLQWLADQGATFALPFGRTKGEFPKGWQKTPHTFNEALAHAQGGNNVGVLVGWQSDGIVAIDRDVDFPGTVIMLGDFAKTAKIIRTNASERGKLLYRIIGVLPPSNVWKENPTDKHPACEFLSNYRHALAPPSVIGEGYYQLLDTEYGIQELTVDELDYIWRMITGESVHKDIAAAEKVIAQKTTEQETKAAEESQDNREYVTKVKDAWPTAKIFKHFERDVNGVVEDRADLRILGNGGLMVKGDKWYCYSDQSGGGPLEAWAFCKWNKGYKPAMFWDVINSMAEAAGIVKPEYKKKVYTNGTGAHTNGNGQQAPQAKTNSIDEDEMLFLTVEDVIDGLHSIRDNAELSEWDCKEKVIKNFSLPISNLDSYSHIEIEAALSDKRLGFTKTEAKQFLKSCVSLRKQRDREAEKKRLFDAHQRRLSVSRTVTDRFDGHEIQTNNRQIKEVGDKALAAILAKITKNPDYPIIYVKGGMLARVAKDEDDMHSIQASTPGGIYVVLGDVARWINIREGINGEEKSDVFPPQAVAQYLFNSPDWPGIPAIESVVNTPIFGRNGVFHTEPGYNSKTRLYYTGGVELGDTTPTPENIEAAKNLIVCDLLVDFPFKDDASHAHAIAYLLLPFVRQMVDGPTPLHMVESPTPGTGKGKLVNACAYVALGHDAPTMSEVEDDAEWRKSLTSFLMTGKTHLCIDNVNHGIDSGVLANALTQPYWADRVLGANRDINIKISAIWSATGNNVPISEEIARRCVLIRLDANVEKPWERTEFKHPNLMEWVREHRNELVTACCTLVRTWIEKGKPRFTGKAKGSYESWANVMGGILEAAGVIGFLQNENEMFDKTINANQLMADFVVAWWEKFHEGFDDPDRSVSSNQLFKLASYSDDNVENAAGGWENLLGDLLGTGKQRSRQTKLGMILNEMSDKVIGEYKICFKKISRGQRYYALQKID